MGVIGGMVRFVVYGEPVSKERPRTVSTYDRSGRRSVHTYTPKSTKEWEQEIAWAYKSLYKGHCFHKPSVLRMVIDAYLSIPGSKSKKMKEKMKAGEVRPIGKRDVDNIAKAVADAGNGLIYDDDTQIVEMTVRKFYSDEPRVEIYISEIGESDE